MYTQICIHSSSYTVLILIFQNKTTPTGIPVSGPVQTEKDMQVDFTIMPLLFTHPQP